MGTDKGTFGSMKNNNSVSDSVDSQTEQAAASEMGLADQQTENQADKQLETQWHRVRSRLRAELGEATFNSWFKLLEVRSAQKGRVVLQVPTRFVRSWIEAHYLARLRDHWQAEDKSIRRVDIELQPEQARQEKKPEIREQKAVAAAQKPDGPAVPSKPRAEDRSG